ncbi:unnamed protein product (macronuclear) [Paramecium tetraurelia]|uniref:Uncharacterized protein n=1 Tax=Paramecium tetraurelia TaxID=5888 RepID=A0BM54_PARTE|nr:uncharacterized protein GSPATT00030255001 [Paramecium tetraurelia]CAK59621.1 unnamed protein product [Paramecium tetraurelia]|eukprot:XP_001427019.1 hypothetical protein (macronuclear) [Paramecium tetraurelia strain d4-2]
MEKLASTSAKNGNDLFESVGKLTSDIQQYIIYLDNTFQKVFAISKVELVRLPDEKKPLENFIDLIFHIACQKGIKTIAFHLRKEKISNTNISIHENEKILQLLADFQNQKDSDQQGKMEKKISAFALQDSDYIGMRKKLNFLFFGKEHFQDLTIEQRKEQEQVFSIFIQIPNSNKSSSCYIQNKNQTFTVLSNFQIRQAHLYETNLSWTKQNSENKNQNSSNLYETHLQQPNQKQENKIQPRLFLEVKVIESKIMKNNFTYETTLTMDTHQKTQNHLMFVFNSKVLAFQFPLKFTSNQ